VYTRDEPPEGITSVLFELGYSVVERAFSQSFPDLMREFRPDVLVAVLDPLDPEDGNVVRFLSARLDRAIFLVLSTLPADDALEAAMTAGADAALSLRAKPSLVAAQLAALQRRMGEAEGGSRIVAGELALDVDRRSVSHMGKPLELTRSEFDILAFLARNAGRVMTPVEILSGIGQLAPSEEQARGMVKVHLSHVRQKLGTGAAGDYIATVRGIGYVFERPAAREVIDPPASAEGQSLRAMA
jgi:DNA-binding response OmpR family regulator